MTSPYVEVVERVRNGELGDRFTFAGVSATALSVDRLSEVDLAVALPRACARQVDDLSLADTAQLTWFVTVPDCALHSSPFGLFQDAGRTCL